MKRPTYKSIREAAKKSKQVKNEKEQKSLPILTDEQHYNQMLGNTAFSGSVI